MHSPAISTVIVGVFLRHSECDRRGAHQCSVTQHNNATPHIRHDRDDTRKAMYSTLVSFLKDLLNSIKIIYPFCFQIIYVNI